MKKHFFLKLNPPRPTFTQDMTIDEKAIMQAHVAYWKDLVDNGTCIVLGPVFDPKGAYGISVVEVENKEAVKAITSNDPAVKINTYEIYPMRAVSKQT